ncbi:LysR family transcriptional regulator [Neobacillus sp. NRS-1170]|uniref:LysR family transcriptional regulator n=1 Tax=Neobacillus sp. NRS-1170 TaxID=3233898 RepID=UPI003D2A5CFA
MRIEQLLYITEIAKNESIAITSERFQVSSQGISQAIQSLENELGVRVFTRSRSGLYLTEAGKELIEKAHEVLQKLSEFKEVASNYNSPITGNLTISASSSLCSGIIPHTIASFKTKFPSVTIDIIESPTVSQVRKNVLDGSADLGFISIPSSFHGKNKLLTITHLLDSPLMIFFRKDSELANKDSVCKEDIMKYQLAAHINDSYVNDFYKEIGRPHILLNSNSAETRNYFILQGLALGLESALSIKCNPFYKHKDIMSLPIEGIEIKVSFYCIRLKNQHLSIAAQEFLKELNVQISTFEE